MSEHYKHQKNYDGCTGLCAIITLGIIVNILAIFGLLNTLSWLGAKLGGCS